MKGCHDMYYSEIFTISKWISKNDLDQKNEMQISVENPQIFERENKRLNIFETFHSG
jgi:hypothetical protein